ncbi:unnamed protein product [Diatraea saccharalis]|uniref:Uncharacterized protein n=1 Tax=Diatraea saccharalis TaxID=40085 RepID=A0A9N9QWW1_9NEOP|nr:unnamed protein product [Diatraea saccharalis]
METYANKIKELSKDCGYEGHFLERQLRDRFASGLNRETLQIDLKQKWLDLQEHNNVGRMVEITFEQIFNIAQLRELAENDTPCNSDNLHRIQQGNVNKRFLKSYKQRVLKKNHCKRCGKTDKHTLNDCAAISYICKACNIKGHFESCCLKSGRAKIEGNISNKREVSNVISGEHNFYDNNDTDSNSNDDSRIHKINVHNMRCKKIDIHINGKALTMDWDPGSIYSIISTAFWRKIGSPELVKGPKLRAYGDHRLKPKGLTDVTVEVDGKQKILPVVVINCANHMLFGLQWSEMFNMNFPSSVYSIKTETLP